MADNTVSEFAPGSTTPTATLTGLNGPSPWPSTASGNLYVANQDGSTVSEFAPGSTTPTRHPHRAERAQRPWPSTPAATSTWPT